MNRRAVLAGVLGSAAAGLAGCLDESAQDADGNTPSSASSSDSDSDPDDSSDESERPSPSDGGPVAQFQYGSRNTGVVETTAPRSPVVQWETRLSPIDGGLAVANDRIVVAATGNVVALDTESGDELWEADVGHDLDTPPALDDETAYVTAWNGGPGIDRGVAAIDLADGSLRWRAVSDVDISSAPTLWNDTVYVGGSLNSDELIAIDAETGSVQWRFEAGQYATTPAVADGTVFVGGGSEHAVYALDAENGEEQWRFETDDRVWSAPTVVDDTVYAGSRDGWLYALVTNAGEERWSKRLDADIRSSVAASNDCVYVSSDESVTALETNGDERWSFGGSGGAPSITDDSLVTTGRVAFCLDIADGSPRWRYEIPDRLIGDATYMGSGCQPVVADGVVYVASHGGDVLALADED